MPKARSVSRKTIHSVKGGGLPLTPAQRELVAIFVEHLRSLPPLKDWLSSEYHIVNRLLGDYFESKNPTWIATGTKKRTIADLPDNGDHFTYLMENAANAEDPMIARRIKFLEIGRDRKWVIEFAERYERKRADAGLAPENILSLRGSQTPIERIAAAAYIQNQAEAGSVVA